MRKIREIVVLNDIAKIPLTRGQVAIIDAEDIHKVSGRNWSALKHRDGSFLAVHSSTNKTIYLHRLIMNFPDGFVVDHINHDRLDNRKSNLRICTNQKNQMNQRPQTGKTSVYKGVYRCSKTKYMARIKYNGSTIFLGRFSNEIDAAKAYDKKAIELFGEFANTNLNYD